MSGEKEVRLRECEYHRLMKAAEKVEQSETIQQNLQYHLEEARQRIQENSLDTEKRRKAMEKTLKKLSTEMQQQTRDFQQKLQAQQEAFAADLEGVGKRLDAQRKEYQELISTQSALMEAKFASLDAAQRGKEERAKQWLEDSGTLLDYIEKHQRHGKFAPGELEILKGDFERSRTNVKNGDFETAIATGQALYTKALRLQAEIEFRQTEWDACYNDALNGLRKRLAEMEAEKTARWIFETEEGKKELDAELDYWTDEGLARLRQEALKEISLLENNRADLSLADLQQLSQKGQLLEGELLDLVTLAKERLVASQLRVNIAQDVVQGLADSGWELEESLWEGEGSDGRGWKNSYHMKMRDLAGNEMVTIILPEERPRGEIENRLQFAYFPKSHNDARFAAAQTRKLNETLGSLGITQSPLQCVPGHERTLRADETRRDFEKIRNTKPVR